MKFKKLILTIISALLLAVLTASLSACDFINDFLNKVPSEPPAQEQPSGSTGDTSGSADGASDDTSDDTPDKAEGCVHQYGEWVDVIDTCTRHTQKQICGLCGDVNMQSLKPSGHKYTNGVCDYCKQSATDGDAIDKYNGDYGYNYFGSQNLTAQQTLYARIDEKARSFHTNMNRNVLPTVQNGNTYYIVNVISYYDLGLTGDEAVAVWKTFKDDNPLYYWISSELLYTSKDLELLTVEEYALGAVRSQKNDFIYDKVEEYSLLLESADGAYEKALAFHDMIISAVDYAYDDENLPQSEAWAHNILGVFEGKGAVCEGYAKTFQLLMNYNGVENLFVSGLGNGGDHAWNLVKLDGGGWYWCDLTWDDLGSSGKGISYNYFLVNDTQAVNAGFGGIVLGSRECFLDRHTPHTPQGKSVQFLYELPERAVDTCKENKVLSIVF